MSAASQLSVGRGGGGGDCRRPILRGPVMKFGRDFFKILNLVIAIMRMFAGVFGDQEEKDAVADSKKRTASDNADEVC